MNLKNITQTLWVLSIFFCVTGSTFWPTRAFDAYAEIAFLILGLALLFLSFSKTANSQQTRLEPLVFTAIVAFLSALGAAWREFGELDLVLLEQLSLRVQGTIPMDQMSPYYLFRGVLSWKEGLLILLIANRTPACHKRLYSFFIAICVCIIAVGISQRLLPGALPEHWLHIEPSLRRVGSIFEDPNIFGAVLCLVLPLLRTEFQNSLGKTKGFCLALLGLGILCLLWTWSRSALAVAGIWMLATSIHHKNWKIFALLFFMASLLFISLEKKAWSTWASKSLGQTNVNKILGGRLEIWSQGVAMLEDFPALGSGIGTVFRRYPLYCDGCSQKSERTLPSSELEGRNLHNIFLQISCETGFLGLTGFIWLIFSLLHPHSPAKNPRTQALQTGILLFLLASLTGHPFSNHAAIFIFFLACSLIQNSDTTTDQPPQYWRRSVWIALAIAGGLQLFQDCRLSKQSVYELGLEASPTASRSWEDLPLTGKNPNPDAWKWMGKKARFAFYAAGPSLLIPMQRIQDNSSEEPFPLRSQVFIQDRLRSIQAWKDSKSEVLKVPLLPSEWGQRIRLRIENTSIVWKDGRPLAIALASFQTSDSHDGGFHQAELNGAWSRLWMEGFARISGRQNIIFTVLHPDLRQEPLKISIYLNDIWQHSFEIQQTGATTIPITTTFKAKVRLECSRMWSPSQDGSSQDRRNLGLFFSNQELQDGPVAWERTP